MDPAGALPPMNPRFGQIPFPTPRGGGGGGSSHHRRAQSETFIRLPDDLLFDSDPDFEIPDIDFSSLSDDNVSGDSGAPIAAEPARAATAAAVSTAGTARPIPGAHLRSLSVDAAFFEGLSFQDAVPEGRGHHRRSGSMDGPTSSFEGESAPPLSDLAQKTMPSDKLAELALIDPKRAKRILANRQSAARSKERKIRYTSELERKVETLQTEATSLSAQLTLLQKDSTGLTAENRELKLRLQAMEQQAKLREALSETLREEVERLKKATRQLSSINQYPDNILIQQSVQNYYTHHQQLPHPSNTQSTWAPARSGPLEAATSATGPCPFSVILVISFSPAIRRSLPLLGNRFLTQFRPRGRRSRQKNDGRTGRKPGYRLSHNVLLRHNTSVIRAPAEVDRLNRARIRDFASRVAPWLRPVSPFAFHAVVGSLTGPLAKQSSPSLAEGSGLGLTLRLEICKDRFEAEVWLAGLKALVYSGQGGRSKTDVWSNSGPYFDVVDTP
ncbi:hypothetical protein MUK42_23360 [Musa troglodytarum]|uniref:BZIP domain-containing protein n=1 Tax=Musa troglodytarum TaxID=320322 RepID=A0A9E7GF92_9LILI|nr:hypothetical protein MUK42_23360 [Musa troglodytarum]